MNYYEIIEPLVHDKYWSQQYTRGIKQEVQRLKGKYTEITFDDLNYVVSEAKKDGTRPIAIVNCISNAWIFECFKRFENAGVHPLFLTPINRNLSSTASCVSLDFYNVFYSMCRYLENSNHAKIALLGLNPSSSNDLEKQQAFAHYYKLEAKDLNEHIFWNYGVLEDTCNRFYEKISNYNAVICSNDVVAIKLIDFLKSKNVFVPQDMYVLTIGNTIMSGLIAPKITIAEFDCFKIGQQAVKVYNFLKKNSDISSITTRISGEIIARESTGEAPIIKKTAVVENSNYVNFYADSDVKKIFSLENFFKGIDDFDQHILNGLICNKKYSELSEELFASESTIKYHVKRMIDLVGCKTTAELIETLKEYIDF